MPDQDYQDNHNGPNDPNDQTDAEQLADFILCSENDSPGFIAARESMYDHLYGLPIDWIDMAVFLMLDEEMPIEEMLVVGLRNIWDASLALQTY